MMNQRQPNLFWKFLIVWLGQLISNIGSGLTAFTLGVIVYQKTHSATSYALVMLFAFLPSLLLKPIGGVWADRYDRRWLMVIGDLGSASGLLLIMGCLVAGHFAIWQVYVGTAISSCFAAVQNPAYKASVSDFVPSEMYDQASGLMQLAATSQFLVAPVIAGLLLGVMELKGILMLDIMSFVVAALAVIGVRRNLPVSSGGAEAEHSFQSEISEGVRILLRNQGLVILIAFITGLCFLIGFLQTLLGPMLLNRVSPKSFGMMQSVCVTGLLVSSLLISVFGGMKHQVKTIAWFLGLVGFFYGLIGLTTNLTLIVSSGFLFFFALAFVQTPLEVLIRQNIPNEKQGRVWGLISVVTQLGYPLAYGLAGWLADHVFNPMLKVGGLLAPNVGRIISVGPGRGIGLMFVIGGALVVVLALITGKLKAVRSLEMN